MPIHYGKTKHDLIMEPSEMDVFPEGAEQEHKKSCDINNMIKDLLRGIDVRGNAIPPQYGYDDTTLSGLDHRIQKQELEDQLRESAKTEFSEEEFNLIPQSIREKFGFKKKPQQKNDDQTTNSASPTPPNPNPSPNNPQDPAPHKPQ